MQEDEDDTTLPQIPDDLVADIMDHLGNDKETIDACSVVCKSWSYHARRQLFHKVVVRDEKGGRRVSEFTAFVEAHPEVTRFIKYLELAWVPERMVDEARPHITCAMIVAIVKHLSNLKGITFRGLRFTGKIRPTDASFQPFSVDRITFFDVTSTSALWINILTLFSFKELHIHLDPVNDSKTVHPDTSYPSSTITMQSLKLAAVEALAVERAVEPVLASNCLISLDVAISQRGQTRSIGALVTKSASTLQHVHLDMCALRRPEAYGEIFGCSAMQTLVE